MTRIILLDIDGVLVQPRGYLAALRATVQHFVGDFEIEEGMLTDLEKRGISSEWDMSPLIVAAYWDDIFARYPMDNLSDDVAIVARQIQDKKVNTKNAILIPEFDLLVGQYPAETAFRCRLFSHIPEELRKNLLMDSRNVRKSETFRTFQHFTLGSKSYQVTYQLPPAFEAQSLLLTEDKINFSGQILDELMDPVNRIAVFTARPSRPPREVTVFVPGYAPEAELALDLVGMKDVPLVAFGKLEYIASRYGLEPAALVKPSSFQALAATLAAWTGDELGALQAAYEWRISGKLNGRFNELPNSFELVVVEDTIGGIRSVRAAGELFRKAGFDVVVRAFGLTCGNSVKASAFEAAGVPHFENWESLIKQMQP
jgi:hypothetical protein